MTCTHLSMPPPCFHFGHSSLLRPQGGSRLKISAAIFVLVVRYFYNANYELKPSAFTSALGKTAAYEQTSERCAFTHLSRSLHIASLDD